MNPSFSSCSTLLPEVRYLSLFVIIGLLCVDLAWLPFATLRFGVDSLMAVLAILTLSMLVFLLHKNFALPIAFTNLATELLILLLFSCVGFVFSYLIASTGGELQDERIVIIDQLLGFYWKDYVTIFLANDYLRIVSLTFYILTPLLVIFSLIWFCLKGEFSNASTLVALVVLGGVLCIGISGIFPSAGAAGYFLPDKNFYQGHNIIVDTGYMREFFDLRAGADIEVSLLQPIAMVSFPSYHACMALLVVLCFWRRQFMYWVMLLLNLTTLVIVPVEGGHHFGDIVGGVLVAILAYYLVAAYERCAVAWKVVKKNEIDEF